MFPRQTAQSTASRTTRSLGSTETDVTSTSNSTSSDSTSSTNTTTTTDTVTTEISTKKSHSPTTQSTASTTTPSTSSDLSSSLTNSSISSTTSTSSSSSSSSTEQSSNSALSASNALPSSVQATSLTTITTVLNGQLTTYTGVPTALSSDDPNHSNLNQTAIIAGSTIASVLLLCALLGSIFIYKRHQTRKFGFIDALVRERRKNGGAGSVGLLDAEFDDDDHLPLSRYRDHPRGPVSNSPVPSLFRARASDSGSIFREVLPGEDVHFVDPFVGNIRAGSDVDLSRIVDDVMGPASSNNSSHSQSRTSNSGENDLPPGAASPMRSGSHISIASAGSHYNDPFRDVSHSPSASSIYYYSPSNSLSTSVGPQSLLGLPAGTAVPKKPSPLAESAIAVSETASDHVSPPKNWLERSPRSPTTKLQP